jgi:Tfp pilus assembly protein PilX
MKKIKKNQKGYIISIISFLIMIIMLAMALSVGFLAVLSQRKVANQVNSSQSYYAAEAGIEDAMARLKKNPTLSSVNYLLNVGQASTQVVVSASIGASKTISSLGSMKNMQRNIQALCGIENVVNASFYYGIEVGEGGLTMDNGSRVMGNVFSGGSVSGGGTIDNDLIVSNNGNSISGVHIKGNAMAYSCLSGAIVDGNLTYVDGGVATCSVGGVINHQTQEISAQPLPIPQSQINDWKTEASASLCDSAQVTKLGQNNKSVTLGPCKINGNLTFGNGVTLTLTGTLYVTGNINFGNGDIIKLPSSYMGGAVFMSDDTITVKNNAEFLGSGQQGSYILVISNSTSDSAISVQNNTTGAVFYTTNGGLSISNGVSLMEATGYKVIMSPNSTIQYSSGIVNIYFSSGTGGGWKITDWQEQ